MAFRLKTRQPVRSEVERVVDKQLALAILALRDSGAPRPAEAIRGVRRRVKKIRAVLRLVRPALGDAYRASNRRLRAANHLLAPMADGGAVLGTVSHLRRTRGRRPEARALPEIAAALTARAARITRDAGADRVLPRVAAILRAERARGPWTLNARGFAAIAPGLERSVRRARRAMRRATRRPTGANYHTWRQRVKDLWFHVRLIEDRVDGQLAGLERGLEALDGCLGEYHDVIVLEGVLTADTPVPRAEAAASLHLLRRYQLELRRRAARLGARALTEKPTRLVRRVRRLWRAAAKRQTPVPRRGDWRRAA